MLNNIFLTDYYLPQGSKFAWIGVAGEGRGVNKKQLSAMA